MLCPNCQRITSVKDSRRLKDGSTYRRRVCRCGTKFSTIEFKVDMQKRKEIQSER